MYCVLCILMNLNITLLLRAWAYYYSCETDVCVHDNRWLIFHFHSVGLQAYRSIIDIDIALHNDFVNEHYKKIWQQPRPTYAVDVGPSARKKVQTDRKLLFSNIFGYGFGFCEMAFRFFKPLFVYIYLAFLLCCYCFLFCIPLPCLMLFTLQLFLIHVYCVFF